MCPPLTGARCVEAHARYSWRAFGDPDVEGEVGELHVAGERDAGLLPAPELTARYDSEVGSIPATLLALTAIAVHCRTHKGNDIARLQRLSSRGRAVLSSHKDVVQCAVVVVPDGMRRLSPLYSCWRLAGQPADLMSFIDFSSPPTSAIQISSLDCVAGDFEWKNT